MLNDGIEKNKKNTKKQSQTKLTYQIWIMRLG